MASLDTRLHDLEGKVRALVTSYLHHGRRLSEQQDELDGFADAMGALEARVAALESYLDTLHRAQAAAPAQAAPLCMEGHVEVEMEWHEGWVCPICAAVQNYPPKQAAQPAPSQLDSLMRLMAMVPRDYWQQLLDKWEATPAPQQPRGGGG